MQRLIQFFTSGIKHRKTGEAIGAEIETSFVTRGGKPITIEQSQRLFWELVQTAHWHIKTRKGRLITTLVDTRGNKILYELGRQNIELATLPHEPEQLIKETRLLLEELYRAGEAAGAYPHFHPILETDEDVLVVPDKRDEIWVALDGRNALNKIAKASAVQFTLSVSKDSAIDYLNRLGENIDLFLAEYPQDHLWRAYISESQTRYRQDRYGGPLLFNGLTDYCLQLSRHAVIEGHTLVPFEKAENLDIPLFLRSIWWHFRLRKHGDSLCIEVRPLPRQEDNRLEPQLNFVLEKIYS